MTARGAWLALAALGASGLAASGIGQWIGLSLQLGGSPVPASRSILSEHELEEINTLSPQAQAMRLLERAINHYQGALEQIESRVGGWTGKITLDQKLNDLTGVAYCSNNLRVRAAAIEISLAGYGLAKTPQSVDEQIRLLREQPEQKFYPLWKLGLLGNRGVETETARRALVDYLKDPAEVNRRWAVNALGMLGTDDIVEPLIDVFRTDPSPDIRERAACNLAESGMLTREQRRRVIPYLLPMTDDPALDNQTRGWVYQALREISGEDHGADPARWRNRWGSRLPAERVE
ncbi:MAG: HEAT repeat domain-containing protein [Bryobacteraceae bacterium]